MLWIAVEKPRRPSYTKCGAMAERVCHLVDLNVDHAFFRSIAKHHDRRSFPVIIGSLHPSGGLQTAMAEEGVPAYSLGAPSRAHYPLALVRLRQLLRKNRIDILHTHCFDPTLLGVIATRLSRTRLVITRHHSDHHIRMGKAWHTRIDSFCARSANHVFAVSRATQQILTAQEGVPNDRISVVYNGVVIQPRPNGETLARIRAEFGLEGLTILSVGRLHEEKGHRFLIHALPTISQHLGRVTLLIAGHGDARDCLAREAARCPTGVTVQFLGWRNDVHALLGVSDVVVLPSLAESFGVAAVEAMGAGVPVVATKVGGLLEVIDDAETGLLVPPADPEAISNAVIRVVTDDALRARIVDAGRLRARIFAPAAMVSGYEKRYEALRLGAATKIA